MEKERVLYIDDQIIATHGAWSGVYTELSHLADSSFSMNIWEFIYA